MSSAHVNWFAAKGQNNTSTQWSLMTVIYQFPFGCCNSFNISEIKLICVLEYFTSSTRFYVHFNLLISVKVKFMSDRYFARHEKGLIKAQWYLFQRNYYTFKSRSLKWHTGHTNALINTTVMGICSRQPT